MNDQGKREEHLTLELLEAIGKNSQVSQRHLARELGVALGLANSYLKRCLRMGLIKISSAPANRYFYYLTPKGFSEKSRLTAKYLSYSFSFYREAADSCRRVFQECKATACNHVALYGVSDLTEIASLRAIEYDIAIAGIWDPSYDRDSFLDIPVYRNMKTVSVEKYILTDYRNPADSYQALAQQVDKDRILVPDILRIES